MGAQCRRTKGEPVEAPDLKSALETVGQPIFAPARTVLFRRGDAASAVYLVRGGRIALVWTATAKLVPIDTFGAGAILGLPAAFDGRCSVTARVVEDANLIFIPVDLFACLVDCDSRLLRQAAQLLGEEVLRTRDYLLSSAKPQICYRPLGPAHA